MAPRSPALLHLEQRKHCSHLSGELQHIVGPAIAPAKMLVTLHSGNQQMHSSRLNQHRKDRSPRQRLQKVEEASLFTLIFRNTDR